MWEQCKVAGPTSNETPFKSHPRRHSFLSLENEISCHIKQFKNR